jgi:hypothetical protein
MEGGENATIYLDISAFVDPICASAFTQFHQMNTQDVKIKAP